MIEYLVAISTSLIVVFLGLQILLALEHESRYIQGIYHSIQLSSSIIELIKNEIKIANRFGCEELSEGDLYYDGSNQHFKRRLPIILTQNSITLTHADSHYSLLQELAQYNYIVVDASIEMKAGDLLVISDCVHSEVVKIAKMTRKNAIQTIYLTHPLHRPFSKNSMVAKLISVNILLKQNVIYLIINGFKTPIARNIENITFEKPVKNKIRFQFVTNINQLKQRWISYATIR